MIKLNLFLTNVDRLNLSFGFAGIIIIIIITIIIIIIILIIIIIMIIIIIIYIYIYLDVYIRVIVQSSFEASHAVRFLIAQFPRLKKTKKTQPRPHLVGG